MSGDNRRGDPRGAGPGDSGLHLLQAMYICTGVDVTPPSTRPGAIKLFAGAGMDKENSGYPTVCTVLHLVNGTKWLYCLLSGEDWLVC